MSVAGLDMFDDECFHSENVGEEMVAQEKVYFQHVGSEAG